MHGKEFERRLKEHHDKLRKLNAPIRGLQHVDRLSDVGGSHASECEMNGMMTAIVDISAEVLGDMEQMFRQRLPSADTSAARQIYMDVILDSVAFIEGVSNKYCVYKKK